METKLDQLIIDYIHDPTDEIKEEIIKESNRTSRISLIYIIGVLNKNIEKQVDSLKVKKYLELSNALLEELKKENIENTTLNPNTGKLEPTSRKI